MQLLLPYGSKTVVQLLVSGQWPVTIATKSLRLFRVLKHRLLQIYPQFPMHGTQ